MRRRPISVEGSHRLFEMTTNQPTARPRSDGRGNARCSAFHPTDPAFELSLHQRRSPRRETRFFAAETKAPEGPWKSNRQIAETKCVHESPAVWWLFALNEETNGYCRDTSEPGLASLKRGSIAQDALWQGYWTPRCPRMPLAWSS
jgi:hypothetical protein